MHITCTELFTQPKLLTVGEEVGGEVGFIVGLSEGGLVGLVVG